MTLIAAVKYNNYGCVVSDFRLTQSSSGVQQDNAFKFISFDNRLMIYMSGKTALLLPEIQEILPTINTKLSFENVDNKEGPLLTVLKSIFEGKSKHFESSIIGIYLDQQTSSFKMFRMDFTYSHLEWDVRLVADCDFTCEIIGSGEILMQEKFFQNYRPISLYEIFKDCLSPRIDAYGDEFHYDITTAAQAVQNTIKTRLSTLGGGVYKKLGISPVTYISIINNSSLAVLGMEYEITKYKTDKAAEIYEYGIQKETTPLGSLIDLKSEKKILIHQTDSDFPILSRENLLFDPENLEHEDILFPKYTLSQEFLQLNPGDPVTIIRSVKETIYHTWLKYEFPVRTTIKIQESSSHNIKIQYIDEIRINLDSTMESNYWDQVDLFDTDWLNQHIGKGNPFVK